MVVPGLLGHHRQQLESKPGSGEGGPGLALGMESAGESSTTHLVEIEAFVKSAGEKCGAVACWDRGSSVDVHSVTSLLKTLRNP